MIAETGQMLTEPPGENARNVVETSEEGLRHEQMVVAVGTQNCSDPPPHRQQQAAAGAPRPQVTIRCPPSRSWPGTGTASATARSL